MSCDDSRHPGLAHFLDLNRHVFVLGKGYWATVRASLVEPSAARPHGLQYSVTLHNEKDERVLGYDNAHPIVEGSGPSRKSRIPAAHDHKHYGAKMLPYAFVSAEKLMEDFWSDVARILAEEDQS